VGFRFVLLPAPLPPQPWPSSPPQVGVRAAGAPPKSFYQQYTRASHSHRDKNQRHTRASDRRHTTANSSNHQRTRVSHSHRGRGRHHGTPVAPGPGPGPGRGVPGALQGLEQVEVSPASIRVALDIAQRVGRDGGQALVVDYGEDGVVSDSLQAIRKHEFVPVLDRPGCR